MTSDRPAHADPLVRAATMALIRQYDAGLAEYGVPLSEAERPVTLGDVEAELADGLMYVQHVRRELGALRDAARSALGQQPEQAHAVLSMVADRLGCLLGRAP